MPGLTINGRPSDSAGLAAFAGAVVAAGVDAGAKSASVQWATNYRGALAADPLTAMASAPTITFGAAGAGSTISTPQTIDKQSPLLSFAGNWQPFASDAAAFIIPDRTGGRVSFLLSGPRADIRVSRITNSTRGLSILVDGQVVTKTPFDEYVAGFQSKSSSNSARQYMRLDFGTNALTYKLTRVSIGVAGTGYAIGDTITIAGGTSTVAAVVRVAGINAGGAITNAVVQTPGVYTALPNNPLQQASTSGAGTGAQFTNSIFTKINSTIKQRRIDLVFDYGVMFGGIVIDPISISSLSPAPNSSSPKMLIAGDSITEYLNADYAAGTWAYNVARRLRLDERFVPYGTAGRGWLASTAYALDAAGVIAEAPDMLVIALGTNDALNSVSTATLTTTVTGHLNDITTALPNTRIVVVGPLVGDTSGTYTTAIAAGVTAATAQSRVRFIDFRALGVYSDTGPYASMLGGSATDIHPSQAGQDLIAAALAPMIGNAFQQMLLAP